MGAERPCRVEYRCKNVRGARRQNYQHWCTWNNYESLELAQEALMLLRDKYDFYVFRMSMDCGE